MSLPDLIEIVPLTKPVRAEITVPGSKSITNRALILAALAEGEVTLQGALWSEDTQVMVDCLQKLGFEIRVETDPEEFCNRTISVNGLGGKIPNAGTNEKPLELFVGNAGTAARFLSAFVCLGNGVYRLSGVPRMHERPQAALFVALRELGYSVEAENKNDKLPVVISGAEPLPNRILQALSPKYKDSLAQNPLGNQGRICSVSIDQSSQFASALLLCANKGNWKIEVVGENAEESPYVAMTVKMIEEFPKNGGTFQIEPDASSGSYFWAVYHLIPRGPEYFDCSEQLGIDVSTQWVNSIAVAHWPDSGWQVDQLFRDYLILGSGVREMLEYERKHLSPTRELFEKWQRNPAKWVFSRIHDLGDSIMTAIIWSAEEEAQSRLISLIGQDAFRFTDLGRLRFQECERVVALRTELTKCGAKVIEEGDTLTVYPSKLHGAEIETYDDHRMAMCFAVLALKVPGIRLRNPRCVKKTFPNFFQKLAAQPPHGLGAEIWEVANGVRTRQLSGDDLFAD